MRKDVRRMDDVIVDIAVGAAAEILKIILKG